MKKDIEWLNNEVEKRIKKIKTDEVSFAGSDYFDEGYIHGMRDVQSIANQLDEPEVLSQKWIDKHTEHHEYIGYAGVPVDDLQNLLVPEQEITFEQAHDKLREESILSEKSFGYYWNCISDNVEIDEPGNLLVPQQELPVIPKFVAEFLIGKEDYTLYELFDDEWLYKEHDRVAKWLYDNDELTNKQRETDLVFARKNGYTVEEEQKYRVIDRHKVYLLAKEEERNKVETVAKLVEFYGHEHVELNYHLTEQEIKDYDKRYFAFAVKVEEMEE